MSDPTAISLRTDPLTQTMSGYTTHGNMYFDAPYMSKIDINLYQGGCRNGLILPDNITFVLSLYPWEKYRLHDGAERLEVVMYDAEDQAMDQVTELAELVNEKRLQGDVLVHCQAGLNRSALIAAKALYLDAEGSINGRYIVDHLRATRSPAVLCNPAFEAEVLSWE